MVLDLSKLTNGNEWMAEAIENPEWHKRGRVHDWRNYIPEPLRQLWGQLSVESRLMAIAMADDLASKENWD